MARDTGTGAVFERTVLPALLAAGYPFERQVRVGKRPGGGVHKVDAVVTCGADQVLLSLKWQQVGGTAEQKVPFEVICLKQAVRHGTYARAYLVLGGEGWKLRDYFVSGALAEHLVGIEAVSVITLERFLAIANRTAL